MLESQSMVVIRLNTSLQLNSKRSWINLRGTKGKRISWGYPSKIPQGSTGASSWAERFYSRTRKRTESKVAQSPPAHPSEGNRESQKQTRRRPSTQRTRRDSWSRSKSCDKTSKSEIRSTQLRARHTTDSSNKTNCWRFRSQRNDRRGSMLSRNSIRLSHSRSSTPTLPWLRTTPYLILQAARPSQWTQTCKARSRSSTKVVWRIPTLLSTLRDGTQRPETQRREGKTTI